MTTPLPQVDPFAVALEAVDVGRNVRFTSIDLDTGARVSVLIEGPTGSLLSLEQQAQFLPGLVLMLTVQLITAAS